jgi:peptidoglycan/xylan/chitin deacetylase (PgdA/CDA1 family)
VLKVLSEGWRSPSRGGIRLRKDLSSSNPDLPRDNYRYFRYPYIQVFDGAIQVLVEMGLRIKYSNLFKGRIITGYGLIKKYGMAYMDIRIIGEGATTFVQVRTGSNTLSRKDGLGMLRREFFWDLDDWLHKAKPKERMRAHSTAIRAYGRPTRTWVPPGTAYKIDRAQAHTYLPTPHGEPFSPGAREVGFRWDATLRSSHQVEGSVGTRIPPPVALTPPRVTGQSPPLVSNLRGFHDHMT